MRLCCTCKIELDDSYFCPKSKRCRDCCNISNNKYRAKNKDRVNERNRANYHRNKTRFRATQRKYELKIREAARDDKVLHAKKLLKLARSRAKKRGIPFSITHSDIKIPDRCPILDIELKNNRIKMGPNSASLDQIIPGLGYIPGNIIVICLKANVIKSNGTPEEILAVGRFFNELKTQGSIDKT